MTPVLTLNALASAMFASAAMAVRNFVRLSGRAWTIVSNRLVAKQLHDFTDYELADIGLTRNDLRDAFSAPLSVDVSRQLAHTAAARSLDIARNYALGIRGDIAAPPVRGRSE
ncbi:DUF1127 domain-containing protein [Oryzibacter oryziterrae]|uniref:DUF1127 domain-containing protein n=1 Tax=Oryzibacter oryziterrae TaxID=2766474 RepID=UPI001F368719|nr:DUF1127 domain-containing protein [Oryzibacter oryziterrae]